MKTTETQPIDVEATPSKAADEPATAPQMGLATVERGGAVGRAMTIDELHRNLEFIRNVMKKEMKEGQDYGKIPGAGDKPTLLQPGAQKLLMTFNLTERVKKEVLREYPNFHREYEFTITVCSGNGKEWDGVGTCSTLESKYRYRKAERRCPACGKMTIIVGKAEYGGGFVCFKKKNGCGAKFAENDTRLTSQDAGTVENDDPADQWNTVRKMAFKRGLVAAAINATNTSELWTQDIEEMAGNDEVRREKDKARQNAPGRAGGAPPPSSPPPQAQSQRQPPPRQQAPPQKPTPAPEKKRFATEETRKWMMGELKDCLELATEYFRKIDKPAALMPNEALADLPMQFVPVTRVQMNLLHAAIADFGNGGEAVNAFPPNELSEPEFKKEETKRQAKIAAGKAKMKEAALPKTETPTAEKQPPAPHVAAAKAKGPDWFWPVICPIPRRGMAKRDYDLHPDTIISLYTAMKSGDEEAGKRLWGFARNWTPEPREYNGRTYPVTEADKAFREALDAFCDWEDKHGKDTKGQPEEEQARTAASNPRGLERRMERGPSGEAAQESFERDAGQAEQDAENADDDIPF